MMRFRPRRTSVGVLGPPDRRRAKANRRTLFAGPHRRRRGVRRPRQRNRCPPAAGSTRATRQFHYRPRSSNERPARYPTRRPIYSYIPAVSKHDGNENFTAQKCPLFAPGSLSIASPNALDGGRSTLWQFGPGAIGRRHSLWRYRYLTKSIT